MMLSLAVQQPRGSHAAGDDNFSKLRNCALVSKYPNDYRWVLQGQGAGRLAETALAQCGDHVSVAVVDRAGRLRVFLQGDGAQPHNIELARRKAYTAQTFKRTPADWMKFTETNVPGQRALSEVIPLQGNGNPQEPAPPAGPTCLVSRRARLLDLEASRLEFLEPGAKSLKLIGWQFRHGAEVVIRVVASKSSGRCAARRKRPVAWPASPRWRIN
jgi:hypothetical protein